MVDTISSMLGIIDGSIVLNNGNSLGSKLLPSSMDAEGELQGLFLENVEMKKRAFKTISINLYA